MAENGDEIKLLKGGLQRVMEERLAGIEDEMNEIVKPLEYTEELPKEELEQGEDWSSEVMNLPRNFTMKQIKDLVFSFIS